MNWFIPFAPVQPSQQFYKDVGNVVSNGISNISRDLGLSSGSSQSIGSNKSINYGDYNGNWLKYLEDMAASGDEASIDKLINYLMSENSAMTARNWTANREDSQYQRLVADMKAAGINPYFAMQGTSPIASSSSGVSYSGNYASTASYREGLIRTKYLGVGAQYLSSVVSLIKSVSSIIPVIGAGIAALMA